MILQMPLARIRRLLSAVGTLKKSGLIGDQGYHSDVPEPMESIVCALLDRSDQPIDELFNSVYECVDESAFTVGDFSHISRHITGLLHVLQDDSGPANVLIYGPPGTGKTELAKALVVHIGKVLYRLNPKNVSYDRSARMERIGAFYQLQAIVSHHAKAAILFDEVEEVFVSGDQSYAAPLKSLLNDLLETNRVPTIWVCNSVENFDPAFVRRFDYVLHVDYPDYTAKRSYLLSQKLSSRISSRGVEVVACHPCLGFGLLARVLKVVRSLPEGRYSENDNQLLAMLNEYLRAMGQPVLAMRERTTVEQHHLPNLFHISVPIDRLVQVFRQCGFGRLLFYGPSGTGKSTAARHVADQCGRGVKVYSGFELMTLCEHFGAGVVDTIFNEVDSAEEVLVLEDVAQCLTPKSWQLGGLVDIVSGRLWACLEQFHGYAIVITSGPVDDAEGVFDVSVSFKALQARQLAALERYAEGEIDALDTLALNRVEAVIDLNHPIKVEQTSVTLADFHRQWRRARVSEVANGSSKDERAKRRSTKRLSLVTSRGCASSPEMP
ncbi:MAG: AAA family ATPase [Gammaproteobacteria bacterium]